MYKQKYVILYILFECENMNDNFVKEVNKAEQSEKIPEFIDLIRFILNVDKESFQKGVLHPEQELLYTKLAEGDIEHILQANKEMYNKLVFKKLIEEYFSKFKSIEKPLNLAVDFNNSNMLLWAEINDNDDELENQLILLQAEINAQYAPKGVNVKTTIIENSDNLSVPPHYTLLPIN